MFSAHYNLGRRSQERASTYETSGNRVFGASVLSDPSLDLHATCVRARPTSVGFGCNNVRAEPSIRHVVTVPVDCALHAFVWTPQAYAQLSRFCAGIPLGRHPLEESEGKSVPILKLKPRARVVFSSRLQILAACCSSVPLTTI